MRYPTSGRPTEHVRDFFTSNYYTGIVEDVPGSHVVCYFESLGDDKEQQPLVYVQSAIKNDDENSLYYVEPVLNSTGPPFKYIAYRTDDILSDVLSNGVFNQTVCQPKYAATDDTGDNQTMPRSVKFDDDYFKSKRSKRQAGSDRDAKKNRCYLALVADHRFYKEIGQSDVKLTSAYLVYYDFYLYTNYYFVC